MKIPKMFSTKKFTRLKIDQRQSTPILSRSLNQSHLTLLILSSPSSNSSRLESISIGLNLSRTREHFNGNARYQIAAIRPSQWLTELRDTKRNFTKPP